MRNPQFCVSGKRSITTRCKIIKSNGLFWRYNHCIYNCMWYLVLLYSINAVFLLQSCFKIFFCWNKWPINIFYSVINRILKAKKPQIHWSSRFSLNQSKSVLKQVYGEFLLTRCCCFNEISISILIDKRTCFFFPFGISDNSVYMNIACRYLLRIFAIYHIGSDISPDMQFVRISTSYEWCEGFNGLTLLSFLTYRCATQQFWLRYM